MNKCIYCEKEINNKGSLVSHQKRCQENADKIVFNRSPNAGLKKGNIPWNKGLTAEEDSRCKHSIETKEKLRGKTHSEQTRLRLSNVAKINGLGGCQHGAGRGKKGWYKGIFCDSSWELAFVIYHKDHNNDIQRCKEIRQYTFENEIKNYYPDFIINNVIYEIKGYYSNQAKAKSECNPDIVVLQKKEIQFYLDYTVQKYGKNFIELYNMEH
mgnify:CR=1 FL=1